MNKKVTALLTAFRIAQFGADWRSRFLLFLVDIINHIDHRRLGRRKTIQSLINRQAHNGLLDLTVNAANGFACKFTIRLNDFGDYQSLGECWGGMYEFPSVPINFLVDGGSNIGCFTFRMIRDFHPKKVICVEPNPHNIEILTRNLGGLEGVTIHPFALSGKVGIEQFVFAGSNTGHLSYSSSEFDKVIQVPTKKLSEIIPTDWELALTAVKLDIEGAEYEVIEDILTNSIFPKLIFLEIHDYLNGGEALVRSIENAGYEVFVSGSGSVGNVCRQATAIKK